MAINLSTYFGVPAQQLDKHGVLDAYIGVDNKLFVDPNLLKNTEAPEMEGARADFSTHFTPVVKLLKTSKKVGDVAWQAAVERLIFREDTRERRERYMVDRIEEFAHLHSILSN